MISKHINDHTSLNDSAQLRLSIDIYKDKLKETQKELAAARAKLAVLDSTVNRFTKEVITVGNVTMIEELTENVVIYCKADSLTLNCKDLESLLKLISTKYKGVK